MKFQFLEVEKDNKRELAAQLRIAYKSHFPSSKSFDEVFEDGISPEISIPNDLYFEDIEKAKTEMYKTKNKGDEPYMKDFISDLLENLSFVPIIKVENET